MPRTLSIMNWLTTGRESTDSSTVPGRANAARCSAEPSHPAKASARRTDMTCSLIDMSCGWITSNPAPASNASSSSSFAALRREAGSRDRLR